MITVHADSLVENATITVADEPPVTASPRYPDVAGERTWPYELRFYDPPPNGFTMTLGLHGNVAPQARVVWA